MMTSELFQSNGKEIVSTHQTDNTEVWSWGLGKSPASKVSASKDQDSKLQRSVKNVISIRKIYQEKALC